MLKSSEINELQTRIKVLEEQNQAFRKANNEKNELLQKLGIVGGGEFKRVKYYIDNLIEENAKLKIMLSGGRQDER